jgi:hypothetical protein
MNENWWGWLAVIIFFVIVQAWRALFRSMAKPSSGMARMNAAAERILKERAGAAATTAANPLPRTKPEQNQTSKRNQDGARNQAAKPRSALLPKSTTPAVIRRNGLLSSGREPVIQRRH